MGTQCLELVRARIALLHPQGFCDRRGHEGRVAERREVDEEDSLGKCVTQRGCRLERQPRLSRAAGARQRDQAGIVSKQQRPDRFELGVSADERRRLNGERRRYRPGRLGGYDGLPAGRRRDDAQRSAAERGARIARELAARCVALLLRLRERRGDYVVECGGELRSRRGHARRRL